MYEFMHSLLVGVHVHPSHFKALLTLAIVVGLWALVSLPAALLIGRAMRLFGHRGELPREIIEAPPEMSTRGRVA